MIQTLCQLNRIAISFATFWCERHDLRRKLYGQESKGRFSNQDRLIFEQQYYVVSYFLKNAFGENDNPDLLECSQHIMKVLHSGIFIQALFQIRQPRKPGRNTNTGNREQDKITSDIQGLQQNNAELQNMTEMNAYKISRILEILGDKVSSTYGNEEKMTEDFKQQKITLHKTQSLNSCKDELSRFYENREKLLEKHRQFLARTMSSISRPQGKKTTIQDTENSRKLARVSASITLPTITEIYNKRFDQLGLTSPPKPTNDNMPSIARTTPNMPEVSEAPDIPMDKRQKLEPSRNDSNESDKTGIPKMINTEVMNRHANDTPSSRTLLGKRRCNTTRETTMQLEEAESGSNCCESIDHKDESFIDDHERDILQNIQMVIKSDSEKYEGSNISSSDEELIADTESEDAEMDQDNFSLEEFCEDESEEEPLVQSDRFSEVENDG